MDIEKHFSGQLFCCIIGCMEILTHLMSQSFLQCPELIYICMACFGSITLTCPSSTLCIYCSLVTSCLNYIGIQLLLEVGIYLGFHIECSVLWLSGGTDSLGNCFTWSFLRYIRVHVPFIVLLCVCSLVPTNMMFLTKFTA